MAPSTRQKHIWFKALREYGRGSGATIRFVATVPSQDGSFNVGSYTRSGNKINLSSLLKRDLNELIYTLAHEIGHHIDFSKKKGMMKWKKYCMFHNIFVFCTKKGIPVPKRIRRFLFNCEKRACVLGERVLRKLKIDLDKKKIKYLHDVTMGVYMEYFSLD